MRRIETYYWPVSIWTLQNRSYDQSLVFLRIVFGWGQEKGESSSHESTASRGMEWWSYEAFTRLQVRWELSRNVFKMQSRSQNYGNNFIILSFQKKNCIGKSGLCCCSEGNAMGSLLRKAAVTDFMCGRGKTNAWPHWWHHLLCCPSEPHKTTTTKYF